MYRVNDRLPYSIHILSHIIKKSRHSKTIIILCVVSILVIFLIFPSPSSSPSSSDYSTPAVMNPELVDVIYSTVIPSDSTPINDQSSQFADYSTSSTVAPVTLNISSTTVLPSEEPSTDDSVNSISSILANNTEVGNIEYDTGLERNYTNAYITSAYYYEKSKSLGDNAIAMVVVMTQTAFNELEQNNTLSIISTRGDEIKQSEVTIKKETTTVTACEYIMTLIQSTSISNPDKIEFSSDGIQAEIPFRQPRSYSPSPVVMCIAPQFVSEKWQIFLMNILVMRRYGGHMHIYITSMITEMFNTLKVYESWGSLTIDYWMRMKFFNTSLPFVEPNGSVEWRNQAGAQTDCLLQYKEVADFVAFMDIDEILIPRYSHNYHQEFTSHFSAYPEYHSIFYQKRDVTIKKVLNVTDFNMRNLFSTMKVSNVTEYGKSIVDPLKYNSTWIHHSFQLPLNRMYKVINTEIVHIKKISEEILEKNPPFKLSTMFGTVSDPLIRETDLLSLDKDFNLTLINNNFRSVALQMFDHNFYGPIVFNCYNESFYSPFFNENKSFDVLCPNADVCFMPQKSNINCIHSDAEYVSGPEMYPITFHYAIKPFWSKDIGCYQ